MATPHEQYRGRFAPSPTGPLHMGSLYTALASFLQARSKRGKWWLRIDDLDSFRTVSGATESILYTLDDFNLCWDGLVFYQSQRTEAYRVALEIIENQRLVYACHCSRKSLARNTGISKPYPGNCRDKNRSRAQPHALRIETDPKDISFHDRCQGPITQSLTQTCGDFIVKRRDNIFAYHLAVVVDDHEQKVTEIFRGSDLLDSTPPQIYLREKLSIPHPEYAHIPVVVDDFGSKLSKQTGARPVSSSNRSETLFTLLTLLQQSPPQEVRGGRIDEIIEWAIKNWDFSKLRGPNKRSVHLPSH